MHPRVLGSQRGAFPRAAIYVRVSSLDENPENQLQELRRYVEARGWMATEYVDRGISGAKDRRLSHCLSAPRKEAAAVVIGEIELVR